MRSALNPAGTARADDRAAAARRSRATGAQPRPARLVSTRHSDDDGPATGGLDDPIARETDRLVAVAQDPRTDDDAREAAKAGLYRLHHKWIAGVAGGCFRRINRLPASLTGDVADDVAQQGVVGFLRGIEGYDPTRGQFRAYVQTWIQKSVRDWAQSEWYGTPALANARQRTVRLQQQLQRSGSKGTPEQIVDLELRTGARSERYDRKIAAARHADLLALAPHRPVSTLETEQRAEVDGRTAEDRPDDYTEQREIAGQVRSQVRAISDPADRLVVSLAFGVPLHDGRTHTQPPLSVDEIALLLHETPSAIRTTIRRVTRRWQQDAGLQRAWAALEGNPAPGARP